MAKWTTHCLCLGKGLAETTEAVDVPMLKGWFVVLVVQVSYTVSKSLEKENKIIEKCFHFQAVIPQCSFVLILCVYNVIICSFFLIFSLSFLSSSFFLFGCLFGSFLPSHIVALIIFFLMIHI